MNRNRIISAAQSIVIVAVCAALGLSLTIVSGAAGVNHFIAVVCGAMFGFIGVCVGFIVRSPKLDLESYSGAVVGFCTAMAGLILAIVGWLVGVFFSQAIGYWLVVVGVLTGCAGLAVLRFRSGARV